jgi:hypothetical protein
MPALPFAANVDVAPMLQHARLPFEGSEGLAAMAEEVHLPQFAADAFPLLAETAHALATSGDDPETEWDVGLEVVLDAVAALRTHRRGR